LSPDEARAAFSAILDQLRDVPSLSARQAEYQRELMAAGHAYLAEKAPKSRKSPKDLKAMAKALGEGFEAVKAPVFEKWSAIASADSRAAKELRDRLVELAPEAATTVKPGNLVAEIDEWDSSTYRSTNSGDKYARKAGEIRQAELAAIAPDVRFELERGVHEISKVKSSPWHWSSELTHYRLFAYVAAPLDAEILKRVHAQTVRDWLKACWGAGVNPRVYSPYLPHGLEEKYGIDYFGREKAPR